MPVRGVARGARPERTGGRQRSGANPADGLERLVLGVLRSERAAGRADGQGDGRQRDGRGRLPIRQHRRLLDGAPPRQRREPGARPHAVSQRHRPGRGLRPQPRSQARHLRGRGHGDVRGPAGQLRPRGAGRRHVRLLGRRLCQVRPLQHPVRRLPRGAPASGGPDPVHAHEPGAPRDRSPDPLLGVRPEPGRRCLDVGPARVQRVADHPRHRGQLRLDAGQLRGHRRRCTRAPAREDGTIPTCSRSETAAAPRPSTRASSACGPRCRRR